MQGLAKWKTYRRMRRLVKGPWLALRAKAADKGIFFSNNDKKLTSLKNRHQGKRCFIIGNGPSLKIEDLDRLKGEITFAANKIFLAFDETEWRPTYYFVVDRVVAENNREQITELALDKYVTNFLRPLFPGADFSHFEIRYGSRSDIRLGVDAGATVIASMIQFAYFMGCREIYLIGVDFDFKLSPSAAEKTSEGDEILVSTGETNHFHPDYRPVGERWTFPKLEEQRQFFLRQKQFMQALEGTDIIFNASRHSKLDVFPRVDFDQLTQPCCNGR